MQGWQRERVWPKKVVWGGQPGPFKLLDLSPLMSENLVKGMGFSLFPTLPDSCFKGNILFVLKGGQKGSP